MDWKSVTAAFEAALTSRRQLSRADLDIICVALGLGKEERAKLHDLWEAESLRMRPSAAKIATPLTTDYGTLRVSGKSEAGSRRARQPVPPSGQPDPMPVSCTAELMLALKAVHVWCGAPSLRELERRSGMVLRRSSISDMLRGESLPDYERYVAFLRTCGINGTHLEPWVFIWRHLKALETPGIAPWMPRVTASK
ncbi:hypothetical protein OG599_35040 (plasmid) [Streptomyces sp. NBC_01335]|uniref:hypothetical protein n=1 Tax=Streptomyces sp. NBC_01335 TaxID=2903828 RepID=UPI002E0EB386|nr:hypothetical protein OG599_35040 [Streptomyces sp. NBC_01335]